MNFSTAPSGRRRIRWTVFSLVVAAAISSGIGLGVSVLTSGTAPAGRPRTASPSTSTTPAPSTTSPAFSSVAYTQLSTVDNHLVAVSPQSATTYCKNAPVDLKSLQIETRDASPCTTSPTTPLPAVQTYRASTAGETVKPLVSCNQTMASNSGSVRAEIVNPATGQTSTGAVVMTYPCVLNTDQLEYAYGAGILWLYDCATSSGPELVEVSATTGALEATVPMPNMCEAAITANGQGLFVVGSEFWAPPNTMYHVAPGSATAVALNTFSGPVGWFATIGNDLWAEGGSTTARSCPGCSSGELVRYVGPNAAAQVITNGLESNQGYGSAPVTSGEIDYFVRSVPTTSKPVEYLQRLIAVNTETGTTTTLGAIGSPMLAAGAGDPSIAPFDGDVYVLDGGTISKFAT